MNKLYKIVSGKGRTEMSGEEIKEITTGFSEPMQEPQSLSELSEKVERVLKILESLKLISSLSKTVSGDDVNGN